MSDFKFAVRQLLKNPGFTAVAVLTLALGIGANTAIFSVVNGVLLKPLPFPESERLVQLSEAGRDWTGGPISYPNFIDWKAQQNSFEHFGLYRTADYNLTGSGEAWRVSAGEVAADVFSALKVQPVLGRVFTTNDDIPGGPRVVVLSHESLLERIRALPGVQTASVASQIPFDSGSWQTSFLVEGRPEPLPGEWPSMEAHVVGPDYFHAMGIPLLRGRTFTVQDNRDHVRGTDRQQSGNAWLNTIVIDEEFARRHFPNEDPIGKQIRLPWGPKNPLLAIVGVVKRVREERLSEWDGQVQGYFSFLQRPDGGMAVVVKAALPPETLIASVRQQMLALDSELPLYDVRTMSAMRADNIAPERLNLTLLGSFAAVALALAVIGLYGVLAHAVTQRQREIGLRMALGAQRRDVLGLVVGHGMKLVLAGGILGLLGAVVLVRVLQNLLFEVDPTDPVTFAVVPSALCLVALLACYLPARRATKVHPMEALRHE